MCPSGRCATNLGECAGASSCPTLDKPFKCSNGNCVNDVK